MSLCLCTKYEPTVHAITVLSPALHMSSASVYAEGCQKGYLEDWCPLLQLRAGRQGAEWVTAERACAECCGSNTSIKWSDLEFSGHFFFLKKNNLRILQNIAFKFQFTFKGLIETWNPLFRGVDVFQQIPVAFGAFGESQTFLLD